MSTVGAAGAPEPDAGAGAGIDAGSDANVDAEFAAATAGSGLVVPADLWPGVRQGWVGLRSRCAQLRAADQAAADRDGAR